MTAAAAVARPNRVRLTRGWIAVPSSVIENQARLTHAELALTLIVLRRGGQTITDSMWETYTGLGARHKENAVRGLRKKCIRIDGRGEKAKYHFDGSLWPKYVTESATAGNLKPRTAGRGVDPKKGAKVHPDCRAHGCALLEPGETGQTAETGLSVVPAPPNAQRVAHSGGSPDAPAADKPAVAGLVKLCTDSEKRALAATKNAQRVARNGGSDPAEDVWAKTLAAIRGLFPLVGLAFLVRLLAVVRAVFADVTDVELAEAVGYAWTLKRKGQKSEGLFLLTVPEALRTLRKRPHEPPAASGPDLPAGVRLLLQRAKEGLEARGAPFADLVAAVGNLHGRVNDAANLAAIEEEMQTLEARIFEVASGVLSPGERNTVDDCVAAGLKTYRERMTKIQLEKLREQILRQETLKVLMLPRLSAFYV